MKQRGKKKKIIKRNEDNLRNIWDNIRCPNIWIIGVPEEEDEKKGHEKILEIIFENFPKMGKEIATQVQKIEESPKQEKSKVKHPKTILIKLMKMKYKEQILKAAREKTTNNSQGDSHKDNSWSFNKNSSGQEGMAGHT